MNEKVCFCYTNVCKKHYKAIQEQGKKEGRLQGSKEELEFVLNKLKEAKKLGYEEMTIKVFNIIIKKRLKDLANDNVCVSNKPKVCKELK